MPTCTWEWHFAVRGRTITDADLVGFAGLTGDFSELHTSDVYAGLPRECIFCHRGDRLRADMMNPAHRSNSFSCGDVKCHTPMTFKMLK